MKNNTLIHQFAGLLLALLLLSVWSNTDAKAALPLSNSAKLDISHTAYNLAALPQNTFANIEKTQQADSASGQAASVQSGQPVQHDAGATLAQQIKTTRAILCVTLDPGAGRYLYAPFSDEPAAPGTETPGAEEAARIAELIRPVKLEVLRADTYNATSATVFYPPGQLQYDEFSEAHLPVYNTAPTLLILLPEELLDQPLLLRLDALICSASSCLPYKTDYQLTIDSTKLQTANAPEFLTDGSWLRYRPASDVAISDTLQTENLAPTDKSAATTVQLSVNASVNTSGEVNNQSYQELFSPQYPQSNLEVNGLGRAIIFGLLAGFILNFMPCVLPVITLKLGALIGLGGLDNFGGRSSLSADSAAAKRSRARFRLYSLFFALGVLSWFAALFAIIGFAGLMWGQLFQSQSLILALSLLLFLLALSLFGVFRLPMLHLSENQAIASKAALARNAFSGGLLATLLATPCSGPLLGGVLGWAVGQPLHFLAVTLLSVGLGMAAPFLLLSFKPGLARFLPKPGNWSLILEKVLAFLLFGTVIYLLSMLPEQKLIPALTAMLLLGAAAWCWRWRRAATRAAALGLAVLAIYMTFSHQPPKQAQWQKFAPPTFEAALGKKNLLLDFTADWCINCRALEATTLSESNTAAWAAEYDLQLIRVDITRSNPTGEALLAALGSNSIPLLAIFPAGEKHTQPLVLRDLITSGQLEEVLQEHLE